MSGPAKRDVSGLLSSSETGFEGGLVDGRPGLVVEGPSDSEGDSRFFESQQIEPGSHKFGGSLMTMEGFEQKADMSPGKQTPGHRFRGAGVVVVDGLAVVEVATLAVVVDGRGVVLGLGLLDGRVDVEVPFLVSPEEAALPFSRRLIQHLPPFEHTAFVSM